MDPRAREILRKATPTQRRYVIQRLDPDCPDAAKAARALKLHASTPHHWDNLEELEEAVTLLELDAIEATKAGLENLSMDAMRAVGRVLKKGSSAAVVSAAKAIWDRIGLPAQSNVDVTSGGEPIKATIYIPDNGRD